MTPLELQWCYYARSWTRAQGVSSSRRELRVRGPSPASVRSGPAAPRFGNLRCASWDPHLEVVLGRHRRPNTSMPSSMPRTRPFSAVAGSTAPSTEPPGPGCSRPAASWAGCAFGDAKATLGYDLPARYVIHTVGPIWQGGHSGEARLLQNCYRRCLEVADEIGAELGGVPRHQHRRLRLPGGRGHQDRGRDRARHDQRRPLDPLRVLRPRGARALRARARHPLRSARGVRSPPAPARALRARRSARSGG